VSSAPRLVRIALSWGVALFNAVHYTLFKLRLLRQPQFRNYPTHWEPWLGSLLGWPRTLEVRFAERCPATGPAVFIANHIKLDDPLFLWGAVERATRGRLHIFFMMRDDFFRGWPWDYLPFSMNELTASSGCLQISRDQISLAQLKPLLQVLESGESFVMFPGRTRSRSGLCIEYRDGIDEPGGVSFFLAHGSRRAGRPIPAVPLARTYNPVKNLSTVAFGEPRYLPERADREAQRAFDLDLAVAISNLTQVHALHVVCLLIYLRLLHGQPARWATKEIEGRAREVAGAVHETVLTDPALLENPAQEVADALRWLARAGMVAIERDAVALSPLALSSPEPDTRYRKDNPVKFHANQVLHYAALVSAAEAQVLRLPSRVLAEA
jgi:1-acyl-sn-glycerol-3-phosphate acyltransferase